MSVIFDYVIIVNLVAPFARFFASNSYQLILCFMSITESSRSEYDTPIKNQVIGARLSGLKYSEISRLFDIPWSSVKDIWMRYLERHTTYNLPRSGRPTKVTPHARRRMLRFIRKNRRLPLHEASKVMSPKISARTLRRVLASEGIHRRRARKAPYLTKEHKSQRLDWAQALSSWNEADFGKVIFSDECYIHVGGTPGTVYVSRSSDEADLEECYAPKFEQSSVKVMVWACIMLGCKGPLLVLDFPGGKGGGMNSERYQDQVLNGALWDFYVQKSFELGQVYFQQDNARCHKSKSTMKWFDRNGVMLFLHPPSSPDLNPIENLWYELKRRIRLRPHTPTSIAELKQAVLEAWDSFTVDDINKFVKSMPNRVNAVLSAKGGNIRY